MSVTEMRQFQHLLLLLALACLQNLCDKTQFWKLAICDVKEGVVVTFQTFGGSKKHQFLVFMVNWKIVLSELEVCRMLCSGDGLPNCVQGVKWSSENWSNMGQKLVFFLPRTWMKWRYQNRRPCVSSWCVFWLVEVCASESGWGSWQLEGDWVDEAPAPRTLAKTSLPWSSR